jgi:hypothetical protein
MHMARSTEASSDSFCAVHRHKISTFKNLKATFSDPQEFAGIWQEREGRNWARITGIGGGALAGGIVLGPLAWFGAPAIGGIVGSAAFGLSGAAATSAGLAAIGGGSLAAGGFGMIGGTCVIAGVGAVAGSAKAGLLVNDYITDVKDFGIELIRDGKDPALICIDGFLTEKSTDTARWIDGLGDRYAGHAIYYVRWESKKLRDLGKKLTTGAVKSSFSKIGKEFAKHATSKAGAMLMPLSMPGIVESVARNEWFIAMRRAEQTGELLKEMLVRCQDRSFVLVGHSLGARAIFRALIAYATIPEEKRLSNVAGAHLLGGAVGSEPGSAWDAAAGGVNGKIYSYFTSNDQVLKYAYRLGTLFGSPAIGSKPIQSKNMADTKIENVDVSEWVPKHTAYHSALSEFLNDD